MMYKSDNLKYGESEALEAKVRKPYGHEISSNMLQRNSSVRFEGTSIRVVEHHAYRYPIVSSIDRSIDLLMALSLGDSNAGSSPAILSFS